MKKTVWLCFALSFFFALGAAPAPKKPPRAPEPAIKTRLDKTAVWVGDAFRYTVEVIHDRGMEFVLDSLKKESLPLAPFIVREVQAQQGDWTGDKRLLEIQLVLSTYETGKNDLTIPPFSLYYFKRQPGIEKKETEAESIRVPPSKVALRSTLGGGTLKLRDYKPVATIDPKRALIALLAASAGLFFLAFRGARWTWLALHAAKPPKKKLRPRDRERFAREGLARIRALGGEAPEELLRFYTEVSVFLRQYLNRWLEIGAEGLTPEEIEKALVRASVVGSLARDIRRVLERCDTVRFGRNSLGLDRETHGELLKALEHIVTGPKV